MEKVRRKHECRTQDREEKSIERGTIVSIGILADFLEKVGFCDIHRTTEDESECEGEHLNYDKIPTQMSPLENKRKSKYQYHKNSPEDQESFFSSDGQFHRNNIPENCTNTRENQESRSLHIRLSEGFGRISDGELCCFGLYLPEKSERDHHISESCKHVCISSERFSKRKWNFLAFWSQKQSHEKP